MILVLDERSGFIEIEDSWDFACVVAGSVIADLALANRIDTDLEQLHLIDSTPTEDPLLDQTLQEIAATNQTQTTRFWIEKTTQRVEQVIELVLNRLVEQKILHYETGGFWELSSAIKRTRKFPGSELQTLSESKYRIIKAVLDEEIPSPRDILLISLLHSCRYMNLILNEEEYQANLDRIEILAHADLLGQSIAKSVKQTSLLPRPKSKLGLVSLRKVGWRELLGIKEFYDGNLPRGFCSVYNKFGPIVQTPLKIGNNRAVLVTGEEANRWVNKHGRLYLRTQDYISDFAGVFGASRIMPGMDGAEHFRLRKSTRAAYSKNALLENLPDLFHHIRSSLSQWSSGEVYVAMEHLSNHMSRQISNLLLGVDCSHSIDELLAYKDRALTVHVQKTLPKWTLNTPKMKRAKKHVSELLYRIKAAHTPALREGKNQDVADAYIELHRQDPQFMPETDLGFPFAATIVASLYMGSAISFCLYNLINHPEIYGQVAAEGEALFANGRLPTVKDLQDDKIDITRRVFLETERMYPVIPVQLRTVMNRCVVADVELEPQTLLLIGHTATHYMEEYFVEPLKFDINRYLPDREEHLQSSVYVPYGLGTHHCLGHRYVELQAILNLLLIVYHFDLDVVPSNYIMRINPFSNLSPSKKMKFRVRRIKHPVPT